MSVAPVALGFEQNARCYMPSLWCDWADQDEWYASLSIGNRHCDPLVSVTITFKGAWVERLGDWRSRKTTT